MPLTKVSSGVIAANAVVDSFGTQSITGDKIGLGAITGNTLASNIINANNIVNASITGAKLVANTVSGDVIGQNAISSNNIVSVNASIATVGTLPKARLPAGSVLQVVQGNLTSGFSSSLSTFTPIGANVSITPISSSSRIVLMASVGVSVSASNYVDMTIFRDSTNLAGDFGFLTTFSSDPTLSACQNFNQIDSPATTSAITYSIRMRTQTSVTYSVVAGTGQSCTLIAMEIAG